MSLLFLFKPVNFQDDLKANAKSDSLQAQAWVL